jgi:hypothetical protein
MQRGKVQLREITPGKSKDTSILKTGHKDIQENLLKEHFFQRLVVRRNCKT